MTSCVLQVRVSRPANVHVEAEEQNSNEDALDPTEEKPKQPVWQSEVKPFLGGVLPAGLMVARTKPVSGQTSELIQVRLRNKYDIGWDFNL